MDKNDHRTSAPSAWDCAWGDLIADLEIECKSTTPTPSSRPLSLPAANNVAASISVRASKSNTPPEPFDRNREAFSAGGAVRQHQYQQQQQQLRTDRRGRARTRPTSSYSVSNSQSTNDRDSPLGEKLPPSFLPSQTPPNMPSSSVVMPCTLFLPEWIHCCRSDYESKRRLVERERERHHRPIGKGVSTNNNNNNNICSHSCPHHEIYLEKAAQIALSIAKKLKEQSSLVHERDIRLYNIVVINTQEGEVEFIETSASRGRGNSSMGSYDRGSNYNNDYEGRNERREICALGRVFYEMFAQSPIPTEEKPLLPSRAVSKEKEAILRATSSPSVEVEPPLRISTGNGNGNGNGNGSGNSNSISGREKQDDAYNGEYSLEKCTSSSGYHDRRSKCGPKSVSAVLEGEGLPCSIVRLIVDMLENETYDSSSSNSSATSCCPDNVVSNYADLISDLTQMVENPKQFLHHSLSLMRWKPVIIADKMHSRDEELKEALEVADRVSCPPSGERSKRSDSSSLYSPAEAREVLMVSGHAGSGKSCFVRELSSVLEKRGWRYLHCKFDRVHRQPLSFIISAFDRYFTNLLDSKTSAVDNVGNKCLAELEELRKRILKSMCEDNVSILCQLIPSMRRLVSDEGLPSLNKAQMIQFDGGSFDSSDAIAAKSRLHHMFGLLVKAIPSPAVLFLDDLHWADQASLDLMSALMGGSGEEIHGENDASSVDSNGGSGVLFVGAYRTAERGDDSSPLATSFRRVKSLSNVNFTEIVLNGLSCDDVNVMVSETLCYPQRLSRSLSSLIHQISTGNPLFVKEFLNDLAGQNLLNYSLSSYKWEWDEELIKARTSSDGVAELLTRKVLRLPTSVLSALRVVSIFGSEVSMQVLSHVRDSCGNTDIIAQLDQVVKEGLINKTACKCSFVHDMIGHSVLSGIKSDERRAMSKEIAQMLLARTANNIEDAVLFIIVDLINYVGSEGASTSERMRHASLNIAAAEKAIQTPDFASASTYLKSGISFLGDDYWSDSYNLALNLFKNSALVQYAQGNMYLMVQQLNEVLNNARCFEDKLDSLNLSIQSSTMMAGGVGEASEKSFAVLEQLGEYFPISPYNETISRELFDTKNLLEQIIPSTISKLRPINDPKKVKAMEILSALLMQCYQQKSCFYPLVGCRMAKITLQYGLHENSALGFCGLALAYATVFNDVSEGYKLGKYALAITTNKNTPAVHRALFDMLSIWKEPLQGVLPELLNAYNMGLKYGRISEALMNCRLYTYRALLSGSNLFSLRKQVASFIHQHSLYNQYLLCRSMVPISNSIMSLTGHTLSQNQDKLAEYEKEDLILMKSLDQRELAVCEGVIVCKMMRSFILRDLDEAEKVARNYLNFFEQHDSGTVQFVNVYRYFYGGLIAFDCFRRTQDKFWKNVAMRSVSKFETWSGDCEWNFQNKLLMLQAEQHFSLGNITQAGFSYKAAITSSRDHGFVQEEAISYELASYFNLQRGKKDSSTSLMKQAIKRYGTWGAQEKARALIESLY